MQVCVRKRTVHSISSMVCNSFFSAHDGGSSTVQTNGSKGQVIALFGKNPVLEKSKQEK